jgi:hypothetical protein
MSWPRPELVAELGKLSRYIACARVTKRPIFEFIEACIRPSDALQVFALEDDYSFGVLQSSAHWEWFTERCSTLTRRFRYTSGSVFDAFPWPQGPSAAEVKAVARAAVELREVRRRMIQESGSSRRALYRALDEPGESPLRDAHEALDARVRDAYGMSGGADALSFLLDLNRSLRAREARGERVVGPGLPPSGRDVAELVSEDCVRADRSV